jgi:RNA polymerase sigma factor (sigma-70 family)
MNPLAFPAPHPRPGQCQPPVEESVRTMEADPDRLPDEVLLARLGTGDVDFAVAFVRRFQRVVFGVALAITGDLRTAEDVGRRAFEQASRRAKAYDWQQGSVKAWLTRIARDLSIEVIHDRAATPVTPDDLAGLLTAMSGRLDGVADAHQGAAVLRGMLARLPATQARAVARVCIFGMTARQVADAEGVPLGTARTRITDGIRKLRDAGAGSAADAAN